MNPGDVTEEIEGDESRPGLRPRGDVDRGGRRDAAERLGYTVVDRPSIIATHLTEIIKRHAAEILGRQEVQQLIDTLKNDYPAVVDEVTRKRR